MQPIATFTKIHGKGNVEVIMNDIVNKELMRQREFEQQHLNDVMKEHEMEMRCMNIIMNGIKNQRDDMRKERYDNLLERLNKEYHKGIIDKAKYAFFYCFACVLVFLMWAKIIEYGYYDENGKWNKIS